MKHSLFRVLVIAAVLAGSKLAAEPLPPVADRLALFLSPGYGRGWCDGRALARESSVRNRDAWRENFSVPRRTHAEVLATIGQTPGHRISVIDSVDLFVVLGGPDEGKIWLNSDYYQAITITCPEGVVTLYNEKE